MLLTKRPEPKNGVVYWHSSENMPEVADKSVKLFMCSGVHLKNASWETYASLYERVCIQEGMRIIREDGFAFCLCTDAYVNGEILPRSRLMPELLRSGGWRLIDVKVWDRMEVGLFQVPFSLISVFTPPGSTVTRRVIRNQTYLKGIWKFRQMTEGKLNAWSDPMCRLLVDAFTSPGDLIVDPFAGSARLIAVAARMGRLGVGYEIDDSIKGIVRGNGVRIVE